MILSGTHLLPISITKKGHIKSNLKHWLDFIPKDWERFKHLCARFSLISNYFMLLPMFITKDNTKKLLYFCTFMFSHIYHNNHCKGKGNSNEKLYYLDIVFSFIHFGIFNNYKLIFSNFYLVLMLLVSFASWYLSNYCWYNEDSKNFHIIHGFWHFSISITAAYMELLNLK